MHTGMSGRDGLCMQNSEEKTRHSRRDEHENQPLPFPTHRLHLSLLQTFTDHQCEYRYEAFVLRMLTCRSERPPPAEKVASADQTTGETQPPSEKVQKSPAELQADADRLIAEGKKAIALKQWEEGVAKYGDALDIMCVHLPSLLTRRARGRYQSQWLMLREGGTWWESSTRRWRLCFSPTGRRCTSSRSRSRA